MDKENSSHTPYVLLADEDSSLSVLLAGILRGKLGYRVAMANEAEAALSHFKTLPCVLVVLNVQLPTRSGIDVLRDIRALNAKVPILMISEEPAHEKECMRAGANNFLLKPFTIGGFFSKINLMVESHSGAASASH